MANNNNGLGKNPSECTETENRLNQDRAVIVIFVFSIWDVSRVLDSTTLTSWQPHGAQQM